MTRRSRLERAILLWGLAEKQPDLVFNGLRVLEHVGRCRDTGARIELLKTILKIPVLSITLDRMLEVGVIAIRHEPAAIFLGAGA